MQITVSGTGRGAQRITIRANGNEFDIAEVEKFPKDSLERSVAFAGVIDPQENATDCDVLRQLAAGIPLAIIRRNHRYSNATWGRWEMERLLSADGGQRAGEIRERHGEALAVAVWERLLAGDAARKATERARIDRLYGLDAHLARLGGNKLDPPYSPPPTRRWNFLRADGTLDLRALREPVVARRRWAWETHGDLAMLDQADLDLFMGVCAASVAHGSIHLVGSSDPDLYDRWRAGVERRAPEAVARHVAQMGDRMPTDGLRATPELLVVLDAAEARMKEIGADPVDRYQMLPRYQYQKWPLSHVLVGKGRTDDGSRS